MLKTRTILFLKKLSKRFLDLYGPSYFSFECALCFFIILKSCNVLRSLKFRGYKIKENQKGVMTKNFIIPQNLKDISIVLFISFLNRLTIVFR